MFVVHLGNFRMNQLMPSTLRKFLVLVNVNDLNQLVKIQHDDDKKVPQSRYMPDSEPVSIGQDLWKQLRRVTILVPFGDKRTYEN